MGVLPCPGGLRYRTYCCGPCGSTHKPHLAPYIVACVELAFALIPMIGVLAAGLGAMSMPALMGLMVVATLFVAIWHENKVSCILIK